MTSRWRSRLKISVTLTLMPAAIAAVIASRPAMVAGILMMRVGAVDRRPELLGLRDRRVGVVREVGLDLDRHAAVDAVVAS